VAANCGPMSAVRNAIVVGLATVFLAPSVAVASTSPEQELADRYAPIVALQEQEEPCGKGEGYRPEPVDIVLGNPDVVLRGPGEGHPVVKTAPTARDLFGKGEGYYLDLPGDPLLPGCTYERELRRWSRDRSPVAYAHVATEAGRPGELALQYWFYYGYNDFNDKHESDWEMIQLAFRAADARRALGTQPYELVYSQHGGAERAGWNDRKLEKVGDRPVVYAAAGSHANYYSSKLWLGRGAAEGFGCDDTRGPSIRVETQAIVVPTTVGSPHDPAAWLAYTGRWGQLESGVNNGPTGPSTKDQWLQPIRWQEEDGREHSLGVPGSRALGPSVTGFFCGAVAAGSSLIIFAETSPWYFLPLALLCAVLLTTMIRRTRWSPVELAPIAKARAAGQILRASRRLYRAHGRVFVGIGAIFLPLGVLFAGVQWLLFGSWLEPLVDVTGRESGESALLAFLTGGFGLLVAAALVHAASAVAVADIAAGREPGIRRSYGVVFARARELVRAFGRAAGVTLLLVVTVVGIPRAVQQLVRWTFLPQTCVLRSLDAVEARQESVRLVRGNWWRTFALSATINAATLLTGLLVGVLFLFLVSSVSLAVINLIGGCVYMLAYPYVAIATTLLFYDRLAGAPATEPQAAVAAVAPG
jgi:hypothetical protein